VTHKETQSPYKDKQRAEETGCITSRAGIRQDNYDPVTVYVVMFKEASSAVVHKK